MIEAEDIRKKRKELGLSAQDLADLLQVKKDNIYKWEKGHRPNDPEEYKRLEMWLSGKMESIPKKETNLAEEPEIEYSQPILNVVVNLSHIGKKNADSIERMAATNERNTEIIAALIAAMLPNSKFAETLAASLSDLHKADLPAEAFLKPAERSSDPKPGGKDSPSDKKRNVH